MQTVLSERTMATNEGCWRVSRANRYATETLQSSINYVRGKNPHNGESVYDSYRLLGGGARTCPRDERLSSEGEIRGQIRAVRRQKFHVPVQLAQLVVVFVIFGLNRNLLSF